jgi:hypothetical protein
MIDSAILQATLQGADGAWPVSCALLIFAGLLSPLEPRARALREMRRAVRCSQEPPPEAGVDRAEALATSLNAIELALIAELNLEQARAHDEVANDAARRPEVRLAAEAYATAWRERAGMFQLEAQRRGGHRMAPRSARVRDWTYTGPERRRQRRRLQTRRGDGAAASERPDRRDRRDRRMRPERRRHDRRVPELAPR